MKAPVSSLRAYHEANKGSVNKGNSFSVPPQALEEEDGFNVRDYDDPDVVAHIRAFADAYKRGDYVPQIVVRVEDGRVIVREGHCRRRGMLLAISEGASIERTTVVEHRGDEVAQNFLILCSNQGLPITALQRAEVYRRLFAWGQSVDEIAAGVGKSATHVAQFLQLINLPVRMKEAIRKNEISATAALDLFNAKGRDAIEALDSALQAAATKGKCRVSAKHLSGAPRLNRKVAYTLATQIDKISDLLTGALSSAPESEMVIVELPAGDIRELLSLRERLTGASKEPAGGGADANEETPAASDVQENAA